MKRLILHLAGMFCIIGFCGFLFFKYTDTLPTYLEPWYVGNTTLYKFNINTYWKIVRNTAFTVDFNFLWGENPLKWQSRYTGNMDLAQFFADFSNNIAFIFNIIIQIINVIIFLPMRLGVWLINMIFTFFGISINALPEHSKLDWLKEFINFVQNYWRIPLIAFNY